MVLRDLHVANFKAIGDPGISLRLAPLTLLVGENGAGKSSALEPLLVLAQSARPEYQGWVVREGIVAARDASGPDGGFREFVHRGPGADRSLWVRVGFEATVGEDARSQFAEAAVRAGPQVQVFGSWPPSVVGYSVETGVGGDRSPYEWEWRHSVTADGRVLVRTAAERQPDGKIGSRLEAPWLETEEPLRPLGTYLSEILRLTSVAAQVRDRQDPANGLNALVAACVEWLSDLARNRIHFLRHLRGTDLDMRGTDVGGLIRVGPHGENTLALVSRLQGPAPRAHLEYLRRWLAKFDLASLDTRAGKHLEGWFTDRNGARVEVHHAAGGSRAILPVVVQLLAARRGDVVLIEEPETTQHPRWQVLLAELLLEATLDRGVQVISTTHAPDFVLAVSRAMTLRSPPSDHVAVWEFRRLKAATEVKRLEFHENRRLREWVPSFRAAEDSLLEAWCDQPEAPDAEASPATATSASTPSRKRRTSRHPTRGRGQGAPGKGRRRPRR